MLITHIMEDGEARIYVTRFASIVSYFTENPSRNGVTLHIEPGLLAYPADFERSRDALHSDVVSFVSQRLNISTEDLLKQPFRTLRDAADPAIADCYRYARRSKNRAVPRSF